MTRHQRGRQRLVGALLVALPLSCSRARVRAPHAAIAAGPSNLVPANPARGEAVKPHICPCKLNPAPSGASLQVPPWLEFGAERPALPAAERPALHVEFERPYPLLKRPRREGVVEASVEDEKVARWNLGGSSLAKTGASRDGFHAAPRIVVDLVTAGDRGATRSERRLLAALRSKGYWPIRLCYEEALRRDPARAKPLAGEVEVRLRFGVRARPRSVQLGRSELEDRELLECVKARLGALEVGASAPARTEVRLEIGLWPGDAPLPSVAPRDDSPSPSPAFDVEQAAASLEALRPGLVACYEQAASRDASLWGRTEFRLDLDAEGHLAHAEEHESHFPDRSMVTCLLSTLNSVHLPSRGGTPLSFIVAMRWGHEGPSDDK